MMMLIKIGLVSGQLLKKKSKMILLNNGIIAIKTVVYIMEPTHNIPLMSIKGGYMLQTQTAQVLQKQKISQQNQENGSTMALNNL